VPKKISPRILAGFSAVLLATAASGTWSPAGAQVLPSRWSVTDVGRPASPAGSATFVAPSFTVASSGYDVNSTADQFTYVYRPLRGDSSVVVKVASLENTNPWSQAGIMFRDSLAAGASEGFVFASPSHGLVFRTRRSKGSQTVQNAAAAGGAPMWLRLDRRSSKIVAYRSADGVSWTLMGVQSVSMSSNYLVGIAVASHWPGVETRAVVGNVIVNGQPVEQAPNTAPTVSLSTDKTNYVAPAAVVMAATAGDSDGAVAKVDFYDGTALVGTRTGSPFVLTWNTVSGGAHALKAIATDNAGATTASSVVNVNVTIPNAVPTVSVQTDKVSYTAPASIVMNALAGDSDGSIAKVDFYVGTTLVATDNASPYSFTWANVPTGTYAIKAVATDNAGAFATSSIVNATVTAPNVAPTVSMTTDKGSYTAPASVVMTAVAADSDGTVARVDFYNGATLVGTAVSSPFAYSWNSVAAGSYALKAVATDSSGASTPSAAVNITVAAPNVAPTVSMTTDKGSYTAPASVVMTAVAADSDGTVAKVDIYNGATLVGTAASSPFAYSWNSVAAGSYALKAVATDNSGASKTSAAVNVTVSAPNVAPTVSMTTDKANYTTPAAVLMSAVAADSDGSVARVDFYNGSTLIGTDTTSPFGFTWNGAPAGNYALKAVATDNSGASTTSATLNVSVAAANAAPTVSLTTPVNLATFTVPASIAIAATAADSDGTVAKVDFYSGTTLLATDAASPYGYTWTGVAAGTYALKAVATDDKGATTATAVVNVTVSSNAAPTVSLTSPAAGASFSAPASVSLTASATDSDGTIQKVEFYSGTTLLGVDTTSPYSFSWTGVATGTYSVSAVATDNLGAKTVSSWRDVTVTATPLLSTAVFAPAVVTDSVSNYVLEVFAAGADPDTAAPVAVQNLGLPAVVSGVCSADVRATILALAPGSYSATVSSISPVEGKLRSNPFSFAR
jgi:predicted phage tail protein